jgi:integrase/recombinase XerD
MLMPTVDSYLALRRAAGYRLRVAEGFLRHYARFASERGETHLRAQTMIEWAALAPSASQRGRRLEAIAIFARHVQAEDTRHEVTCFPVCDLTTAHSSLPRNKFVSC